MLLSDFFSPLDLEQLTPENGFVTTHLGFKTHFYTSDFPELEDKAFDLAILGVQEDRGAVGNEGCAIANQQFRKEFYALHQGPYETKIVDLGNIKAGATLADTYFALKTTVEELVKRDILPIIIGGGQDLTFAQYQGYENLEQRVDLVIVDAKMDLEQDGEEQTTTTSQSYLTKILLHEPNYLFNCSNLGYQTYFVSQESLRVMDQLYFDAHRLGAFTSDLSLTEPIIRNASMISFDIGAIRSSDASGNANANPNGFFGQDACRIARYAGMNDKLTSIGFYEYNPLFDKNRQTAMLLAQVVWYFVDGFYNRKQETPMQPKSNYMIYRANLADGSGEITFVKSKKSDRWWMQVPYPSHNGSENERYHWIPCRYEDYTATAADGEMPDLWWRTYQKLV